MLAFSHYCRYGRAIDVARDDKLFHHCRVRFGFIVQDVPIWGYGLHVGLCVGNHFLVGLARWAVLRSNQFRKKSR